MTRRKAKTKTVKKAKAKKRRTKRPKRVSEPPCADPKPTAATKEMAPCFFCGKLADKADMFCFGCKTVICGDCDVSCGNYGTGHPPEAHLVPYNP